MGAEGSNLTFPEISNLLEMNDSAELRDHYQLLCEANRKWINALIVKGYAMEQARIRHKDMDCGHHQYPSIPAFISDMIKLADAKRKCTDEKEEDRLQKLKHKLFDDGICKECALYITVNMDRLLTDNKISSVKVSSGGKQVDTIHIRQHDVHEYVIGANNVSLLIPCMQYPQCHKVIFNQSNLWITHLFHEFNATVISLHFICNEVKEGKRDCNSHLIAAAFSNLAVFLFQMIRNLSDWKRQQWAMVLASKCESCHLDQWLDFVGLQLESGCYQKHQYGLQTMYCFLVLICCAVKQMNSKWFHKMKTSGKYSRILIQFNAEKLRKWCRKLKRMKSQNLELSFMYLEHTVFVDNMHKIINQNIRTVAHAKWQDMQCQRRGCGHRRSCCTLRKCSSCKVARYCSRRCQKRSWNAHKSECYRLRSMRRQKSRRLKDIRGV